MGLKDSKKKQHDASAYRGIIRDSKAGDEKQLVNFLERSRALRDPYYSALALFTLSKDIRLDLGTALATANETVDLAAKVEQQWRKAELLAKFVKQLRNWRKDSTPHDRNGILDRVVEIIDRMPEGQGLSDAINGCSSGVGKDHLHALLSKAITNKGFEVKDSKSVIRHLVDKHGKSEGAADRLLNELEMVDDPAFRAQVLGYLHLQLVKKGIADSDRTVLQKAIDAAVIVDPSERREIIHYLARICTTKTELEIIEGALDKLQDNEERARVLATLGGSADKAGFSDHALKLFNSGLEMCKEIHDNEERAKIELNLANGLARCGERDQAFNVYETALQNAGSNNALRSRIISSMKANGFEIEIEVITPKIKEIKDEISDVNINSERIVMTPNNILALYDTYEGGLKTIHLRAVARAAPLCMAFELDLALLGFPASDLNQLVDRVISETDIGQGGKYLKDLLRQGRITMVSCTQKEPPENWDELGLPVATTSDPGNEKKITLGDAMILGRDEHPEGRVCVIMGLGRRGLPVSLLDTVPNHLELTGKNIALETCTAMGVIAYKLHQEGSLINKNP
jgi:hypothetical protein